jgi:hypothetical protein
MGKEGPSLISTVHTALWLSTDEGIRSGKKKPFYIDINKTDA